MKILYVENHAVFASQVIAQFLRDHVVDVVPSLALARDALRATKYELLLVDYDLDDGKGAELIAEIRASISRLLVIGVSAHEMGNQTLLAAGADAVCSKMKFDRICGVISSLISVGKWAGNGPPAA